MKKLLAAPRETVRSNQASLDVAQFYLTANTVLKWNFTLLYTGEQQSVDDFYLIRHLFATLINVLFAVVLYIGASKFTLLETPDDDEMLLLLSQTLSCTTRFYIHHVHRIENIRS